MSENIVLHVTKISKASPKAGICSLFEKDMDFIENEDYFREDTLELGFKNEAERIATEEVEELMGATISADTIERIVVDKLFGSSSFYGEYEIEIIEEEELFLVAFAVLTD